LILALEMFQIMLRSTSYVYNRDMPWCINGLSWRSPVVTLFTLTNISFNCS